jgi:hypothetical protein
MSDPSVSGSEAFGQGGLNERVDAEQLPDEIENVAANEEQADKVTEIHDSVSTLVEDET